MSQPPEAAAPVVLPRGAIAGLSLAAFASGISLRITDALLPRLAQAFELPLGNAAQVITVFAVAYGVAQLLFGPLGDRFGKYRVIAWGTLASALTAALCAGAPSFALLLLARAMAGISVAAIIPLAMAWIGDVTSYEGRQPILARFLIGQIMGVSAGAMAGGYAADHLPWRTPFLGLALLFGLSGAFLLYTHQRLPVAARQTQRVPGRLLARLASEFAQVLALPWARLVLLTVFAEGACVYGAFAFIVSHLHRKHAIPLAMAGQIVMLYGFGGLVFALNARAMLARLGEAGLCQWGGVLVGLAYLVIALAPHWGWTIPACLVAGLGFYMLHNTLQINATQMAPQRRGAAVAAFAASYFTGQSAGIAVNSVLIGGLGTRGVIVAGGLGVLALSFHFARRVRRRLLEQAA